MENIVLIGMPASGKSTVGVLLAKTIGYGYIDTDLMIQSEEHALLSEIIKREGAEGFIAIEERVNSAVQADRCVISTGGSAIYGHAAMEHLRKIGRTVYLKLSYDELKKRLGGKDMLKRGVVMKRRGETLQELYDERVPLYERYADVTVECDGLAPEGTVQAIIAATGITPSVTC